MTLYYGGVPYVRLAEEQIILDMVGSPHFAFDFYAIHEKNDGPSCRLLEKVEIKAAKGAAEK